MAMIRRCQEFAYFCDYVIVSRTLLSKGQLPIHILISMVVIRGNLEYRTSNIRLFSPGTHSVIASVMTLYNDSKRVGESCR